MWADNGPLIHKVQTSLKTGSLQNEMCVFSLCLIILISCFFQNCPVMINSFVWRCSGGSQSPNCRNSCNVQEKKEEALVVGDKGMVMEGNGMVLCKG